MLNTKASFLNKVISSTMAPTRGFASVAFNEVQVRDRLRSQDEDHRFSASEDVRECLSKVVGSRLRTRPSTVRATISST